MQLSHNVSPVLAFHKRGLMILHATWVSNVLAYAGVYICKCSQRGGITRFIYYDFMQWSVPREAIKPKTISNVCIKILLELLKVMYDNLIPKPG